MENKEIKITVPEGYGIDRANSSFECIKFKKKGLTYKDVCRALFLDKDAYYIRLQEWMMCMVLTMLYQNINSTNYSLSTS